MVVVHASQALLPTGWARDVRIAVQNGRCASIDSGVAPSAGDERHRCIVPGMSNLHSHAFQRAMAGLAETRGQGTDSFWSWRTLMYRFGLAMTPDDVQAVAAQLYVEMIEAGYTRVGEFHYLHHDTDGRPYANIAEMAEKIAEAATEAGIGLTLLPVFYAHSGFGGAAPAEGQRRFICGLDAYAELVARCRVLASNQHGAMVGVAPHSLRAVTPAELAKVTELAGEGPIHIHIAEQVREVEDCAAWSGGLRPVEWLLANAQVDARWCLIHATHMTEAETRAMASSGAIAGLCPVTEANLGDGTFPARAFLADGGRFGVGSDSNVLIAVPAELRQLEYSQRLALRERNVLAGAGGSTGRSVFAGAEAGGAAALGVSAGLSVGNPADFVSLGTVHDLDLREDRLLDGWIFADTVEVDCVWVHGRKLVSGGRHIARERTARRFGRVLNRLLAA